MNQNPIIKTKNLSVVYLLGRPNQTNALVDANIEIYPGEFIIFFGPSGCGKSTLLYSIAGLERHIQGDIIIDGKNLSKFNEDELDNHRQHIIGMIFQAYYLISSLNVLNNVVLPQFSLNAEKKDREEKALRLLNFFGVEGQKEKYPNELSGGQQQRVAICRSLMNDPQIILADEPTGNLDSKSATDVMKLLAELNEKEKKTIIVVTHSPGGLEYAHRVFYMKDGQIINIQENRKVGQPLKKEVLESNVLADDLELDEKKKKGGRKTTEALVASSEGEHMLADIKAREIITEALTNLSTHELDKMVSLVSQMITKGSEQKEFDLLKYLDDGVTKGGLGFDTRTAHHITEKIKQVVDEIQELHGAEEKARRAFSYDISPEITSIRHYIFEQFDIQLRDHDAIINFDNLMRERLSGDIDEKGVSVRLNMRVEEGGVGLDKRVVHKIAKRVELLVLGKI